jgi:hypothetical protein
MASATGIISVTAIKTQVSGKDGKEVAVEVKSL